MSNHGCVPEKDLLSSKNIQNCTPHRTLLPTCSKIAISYHILPVCSKIAISYYFPGLAGKDKAQMEKAGKIALESFENIRTVAGLNMEQKFSDMYYHALQIPYK